MKKIVSLALASAMVLGLLAACGGTTTETTPTPAPVESQATVETPAPADGPFNLNINIASEPQTIDPALNSAVDGAIMTGHMFEGLYRWADSGELVDGVQDCDLAELVPGQSDGEPEKVVNEDGTVTAFPRPTPTARWFWMRRATPSSRSTPTPPPWALRLPTTAPSWSP